MMKPSGGADGTVSVPGREKGTNHRNAFASRYKKDAGGVYKMTGADDGKRTRLCRPAIPKAVTEVSTQILEKVSGGIASRASGPESPLCSKSGHSCFPNHCIS